MLTNTGWLQALGQKTAELSRLHGQANAQTPWINDQAAEVAVYVPPVRVSAPPARPPPPPEPQPVNNQLANLLNDFERQLQAGQLQAPMLDCCQSTLARLEHVGLQQAAISIYSKRLEDAMKAALPPTAPTPTESDGVIYRPLVGLYAQALDPATPLVAATAPVISLTGPGLVRFPPDQLEAQRVQSPHPQVGSYAQARDPATPLVAATAPVTALTGPGLVRFPPDQLEAQRVQPPHPQKKSWDLPWAWAVGILLVLAALVAYREFSSPARAINTATNPAKPVAVIAVAPTPTARPALVTGQLLPADDCTICPPMVYIGPGTFEMGSPESERKPTLDAGLDKEHFNRSLPRRQVTISQGFGLGQTEVTQGQWQAVMGSNPSKFKKCGANCPVESVSWNDIQQYIKKLNQQTDNKYGYRLPSEAEWEYAARAGTTTSFNTGDQITTAQANFNGGQSYNGSAKSVRYLTKTAPAGSYPANQFGLFDMHGNVGEWVQDCWNKNYQGAPINGSAWQTGNCMDRVIRPSTWDSEPSISRAAYRSSQAVTDRSDNDGFRLARRECPSVCVNGFLAGNCCISNEVTKNDRYQRTNRQPAG